MENIETRFKKISIEDTIRSKNLDTCASLYSKIHRVTCKGLKISSQWSMFGEDLKEVDNLDQIQSYILKGIYKKSSKPTSDKVMYCFTTIQDAQNKAFLPTRICWKLNRDLEDSKEYIFYGHLITLPKSNGSIQFVFDVADILGEIKSTENDILRKQNLMDRRIAKDTPDIDEVIRKRVCDWLYKKNETPVTIGIIVPIKNEIEMDIYKAISVEASKYVNIILCHVNISSRAEIIAKINEIDNYKYDIIGVSRGGGNTEELAVFNDLDICEAILNAKTPFITGIGHTGNASLSDMMATKRYSLPREIGERINEVILNELKKYEKHIKITHIMELVINS